MEPARKTLPMNLNQTLRLRRRAMRREKSPVAIERIEVRANGVLLHLSHGEPLAVDADWVVREEPRPGGYLLIGRDGQMQFRAREALHDSTAI
ncbi:MAG TPA: hypothetical protein VEL77_15280 [Rugosimonospora sp.]|nr:hypothetical protein [Rugosimonospora sp.]